jgi:hypothetical protein
VLKDWACLEINAQNLDLILGKHQRTKMFYKIHPSEFQALIMVLWQETSQK